MNDPRNTLKPSLLTYFLVRMGAGDLKKISSEAAFWLHRVQLFLFC